MSDITNELVVPDDYYNRRATVTSGPGPLDPRPITMCSSTGLDDPLTSESLARKFSEAERAKLNRQLNWEKSHTSNHRKKSKRRKAKQRAKESRKKNR